MGTGGALAREGAEETMARVRARMDAYMLHL
jgi:hypothetical protein